RALAHARPVAVAPHGALRRVGPAAVLEARVTHLRRCTAPASKVRVLFVALLCLATPAAAFAQSTHLLIVVRLAGGPEHGELFKKWGTTLASTATGKLGVPKDHVILLTDQQATREAVVKAFSTLAAAAAEDDTVAIVLFGHGTYANKTAKFNLVGPDM